MLIPEVMDLTLISQNFPVVDDRTISRENILDTIRILFSENHLVVLEGADGIGKTTLLAQFVKEFSHEAFSLFVSYTSRWAYDPQVLLLDLYKQVYWAVHQEYFAEDRVDESSLALLFSKLRERAKFRKITYYFVVDGLDEVPPEDIQTQRLILDLLPFGFAQFRFLVSGDYRQLTSLIRGKITSKAHTLSGFTLDEAVKFMKDVVADSSEIKDLYLLCSRFPGRLASVRRLISSGTSVVNILSGNPNEPLHFMELEWGQVDQANALELKALAILAHNIRKHTLLDLARVIGTRDIELYELLNRLSFIDLDIETGQISFVSQAFRKFVANKLASLKSTSNELVITDLLKTPESPEALNYLPVLFEEQRQYECILEFLSPRHFAKMMTTSESLVPIKHKADLGIEASKKLGREPDLIKFSVQKSALAELDTTDEWRAEVEARVALNDYEAALTLAQSAVLKEDRFHLLAIIARKKREHGLTVEDELIGQIKQLYGELDDSALSQRSRDIAGDLIFSLPELAIELLEKTTKANPGDNALDWALASLSITAMLGSKDKASNAVVDLETNDNIRSRIKDPKALGLTTAISMFVKDHTVEEVISEAEKLQGASDRLFLLRQWTKLHRDHRNAADVIEYALNTAIKTTPYTFNATVLRELAIPLPFIDDGERTRHLIGIFDSQQGTIEPLGPTEDFVRLQLLLARAEMKRNFEAALNRVIDVYLRITIIDDLDLKTTCLAWLASSLTTMDPELKFEDERSGRIHSAVDQELRESLDVLRGSTGDHYEVTKGAVHALARYRPEFAVEVALSLNTESRRNAALLDYFQAALDRPLLAIEFSLLHDQLNQFTQPDIMDNAVLRVIDHLWENLAKAKSVISNVLPFLRRVEDIKSAEERCRGCALGYSILMLADATYEELANELLACMEKAWKSIDVGWIRTQAGFRAAEVISKYSARKAREYLQLTEKDRDEMKMSFAGSAEAYILCLQLAIRAYSGLLPRNLHEAQDLTTLRSLIDIIPSRGERAVLWADLAIRYHLGGKAEDCRKIVIEHINPLISTISNSNLAHKARVISSISPALYCAFPQAALATILELAIEDRQDAYWQIVLFLLRKIPLGDPYEGEISDGYNLTYEEVLNLCTILDLLTEDWNIYILVKNLANTLSSPRYGRGFTNSQKQFVLEKLKQTLKPKLPDQKNIRHNGYKIACDIHLNRIQNSIKASSSVSWQKIANEVSTIPNLADRAYVQAILGSALPPRETVERNRTFEQAKKNTDVIPATYDKIEHYEILASFTTKSNQSLAKKCLEDAMKSSLETNDPSLYPSQRRLIDLAYKLDANLASSLAELVDDDPAKIRVKQNLSRQIGLHTLQQRMIEHSTQHSKDLSGPDEKNLPMAAWNNLADLNANRIADIRTEYTRDWVKAASNLPLTEAYPILAWVIENAVRRLAKTDQAKSSLRPMFEAIIEGADMCRQTSTRAMLTAQKTKVLAVSSASTSLLVETGQRDVALDYLKDWLSKTTGDYLKICDAYFGPEDLELLQLVWSSKPGCRVQILTSRWHNKDLQPTIEDAFRSHWNASFSHAAPDTTIVVAGTDVRGQLPIHDRWWLIKDGGLRIGTSYNSLGLNRDSEISQLTKEDAQRREMQVDQYLSLQRREHGGHRMLYTMFPL